MTNQLTKYETEIKEIAALAKKLNYNIDGDLKPLLKIWLKEGLKFQNFVEDRKEYFIRTTKQFLN